MSTANEPHDLTVSDDDLTVSDDNITEECKCTTQNLGGSKRAVPTDYSSPVIEIPLIDGFYQVQLHTFFVLFFAVMTTSNHTLPMLPQRKHLLSDFITSSI